MAKELSEQIRTLVRSKIENYENLTPEEQARQAIRVIAREFDIYRERNLMIKDKLTSQIIPFELNWEQRLVLQNVIADLKAGRPIRYIILKARQMGISTLIEAICFWWTTTHRWVNSVIIAHDSDANGNLYNMFRRYYDNCHPTFQPDRKYNTKKDLVFDVEDEVKSQYQERGLPSPGLASQIKTLVAKEGKGRSDTINFLHGSEVAFWEAKADVVSSAVQAVPMAPNTFVFLESTANGIGGYFYDEWQAAKKGESNLKPLFFPWHQHDEYERYDAPETMTYNDEEKELLAIFEERGYPEDSWNRKIMWRREKQKEFRSDPKKFYQEYPKDDQEAFLMSGRPVFDIKMLQKMEEIAQKKNAQPIFGSVVPNEDANSKEKYVFHQVANEFQDQDPTPLKVWELPVRDDPKTGQVAEKYVISIDVSEGKIDTASDKKENDYSVIDVMNVRTLKTAARWRGHIDPDLLGDVAFALGMFYNTALIAPEINNHGLVVAQHLRNRFYRNLYMRESSEEDQFQIRTAKMGWRTDKKTKPIIIAELARAIREGDIIDLDIVFIRECMTYVRDDQGHTNAQEGQFDDTVMAKAINLQMANYMSYDQEYAKQAIHKPIKRNTNATSNSESLESIAAAGRTTASSGVIKRSGSGRKGTKRQRHVANARRRG